MNKKINILGTDYTFHEATEPEIINGMDELDGECRVFDKEIIIRRPAYIAIDIAKEENRKEAVDTVIRHEIIHAVMYESGFAKYDDEDLVDYLAKMIPKIEAIFNQVKKED